MAKAVNILRELFCHAYSKQPLNTMLDETHRQLRGVLLMLRMF